MTPQELVGAAAGPGRAERGVAGGGSPCLEGPVGQGRMRAGAVVAASDIAFVGVPAHRVAAGAALDAADMVGLSPRRSLAANTPIRMADLRQPIVVRRGEAGLDS